MSTSRSVSKKVLYLPLTLVVGIHTLILIRTGWIHEDAFITFRVIRNFLDGFGPVWNIGERVQVFTHPLWMFFLSGTIGLTGEYYYSVIFVSILLAIVTLFLIIFHHATSLKTAILLTLILSLSKAYTDYSTSGLENVLTHVLLALFYLVYFQKFLTPRILLLATFITTLGILNRMDVGVIYLPALIYLWYRVGIGRGILPLIIGSLPLLLWEIFSVLYYGFPFPNTAYAKLKTGVDSIIYIQKGCLYLLHSLGQDPITSLVIGIAIYTAIKSPNARERWMGVGILWYLIYIIQIGGDYMMGRFLTAPFIVSIIYLAHSIKITWSQTSYTTTLILILLIGFMSPMYSPAFSGDEYNSRQENQEGISDERSWYYSTTGLLTTNRLNRLHDMGYVQGYLDPQNLATGGVGRKGFQASSHTYIVDMVGLGDPLLARLPAHYEPEWRMGHPKRVVPDGYLVTRRSGTNMLADPELAAYYDKLQIVVSGDDIWHQERLSEILNFNLGRYEHLIDVERYRYIQRAERSAYEVARHMTDKIILPEPVPFEQHGILINFEEANHAPFLDIGINSERFTLIYRLGEPPTSNTAHELDSGPALYEQSISDAPLRLGQDIYHTIAVPEFVAQAGYHAIHLRPDYTDLFTLTYFDPMEWHQDAEMLHPEQVAKLYYYHYYRAQRALRNRLLPKLFAAMQNIEFEEWQNVERSKMLALLLMPEQELNELILAQMENNIVLLNDQGVPMLRYLGLQDSPRSQDSATQEITLNFIFEVLGRPKEEYSFWFHINPKSDPTDLMMYDHFPEPSIRNWRPGNIQEVEAEISLMPDTYEISFGLWTNEEKRFYVDVEEDIYRIDLGTFTLAETELE